MAAKNISPKKAAPKKEKSTMIKIAETIGTVAGEISVKKEQITGLASNVIKAARSKIHDITAPKVKEVKKKANVVAEKAKPKKVVKAVEKKMDKKVVKPASAKVTAAQKAALKKADEVTKKVKTAKIAAKKAAKKAGSKK